MKWQKLGPHVREERQAVGSPAAKDRLIGVSNEHGLHSSSRNTSADLSRYKRIELHWFAYNPMRVNIGSIGLADCEEKTGITSPDYAVFSCLDTINPFYLLHFLTSEVGLKEINKNCSGAVRKRLYFSGLSNIDLPIPPLPDQLAIVRKVADVKELQKEIEYSRVTAASLLQAMLNEAFSSSPTARTEAPAAQRHTSLGQRRRNHRAKTHEG